MKSYFIELAAFNVWANAQAIEWLNKIDNNQWAQNIISSFNSIEATCIHIAGAEKIWLERWQMVENPVFLPETFKGSKADVIAIWQKSSTDILQFIENLSEEDFQKKFSFKRLNGDLFYMEYAKTFTHIINHSSYHRGQLVTLLRQAGFTAVTSTDVLTYYRSIR
jgi:uncharacterized damage-inducible protein DinB